MNRRKVYIHSKDRNYLTEEYIDLFENANAELYEGDCHVLQKFLDSNNVLQLDTETNVTDKYTERELYVVQLGDYKGREQHIFDITDIDKDIDEMLIELFKSETKFIAHHAKFEYTVLYKHYNIYTKNYLDTFLASKLITAGLDVPKGYNSLSGLLLQLFGIDVSKSEQTTFTGEMMTPEQLLYADTDVLYLGQLLDKMTPSLKKWKLIKCFKLENASIRPIGDMTINGVEIDTEALDENIVNYDKRAGKAKQEMINAFTNDNAKGVQEKLKKLNVIQAEDEVIINWNSSVQKKAILGYLYPDQTITTTAKTALTKLEKTIDNPKFLTMYLNGDYEGLNSILISRHMQFLKDSGMMIMAGNLNLNFNSPAQSLEFFKIWYPQLKSVGVKPLKKLKNPVVMAYKKYTKASKLVTSFGKKMHTFIENDGRIHANFNSLTDSGSRMSSNRPNQQQAPSTEEYRRIYVPRDGWKLVDSDYASMELFLAADLSQDKNLLSAIAKGYDLHSYSAYQIFGQKWLDAGGSATPVGKPTTKAANILRKKSKGASFSLLYGTGVSAFSENNDMALAEGKKIIAAYYAAFPELAAFFKQSGEDALKFKYIREPYFNRVRFFNKPKNGMEVSHIKNAGMNYKPQSSNMSIMKYALCLMKKYIEENDLDDRVKILMSIHDQGVCEARDDYADKWAVVQTSLMEKAAKYAMPNGEIKAESEILEHWTKG